MNFIGQFRRRDGSISPSRRPPIQPSPRHSFQNSPRRLRPNSSFQAPVQTFWPCSKTVRAAHRSRSMTCPSPLSFAVILSKVRRTFKTVPAPGPPSGTMAMPRILSRRQFRQPYAVHGSCHPAGRSGPRSGAPSGNRHRPPTSSILPTGNHPITDGRSTRPKPSPLSRLPMAAKTASRRNIRRLLIFPSFCLRNNRSAPRPAKIRPSACPATQNAATFCVLPIRR